MTTMLLDRPLRNAATSTPIATGDREDDTPFTDLDRRQQDLDHWDECIRALVALRDYEENWDDEGADAPALENVDRGIQYVELQRRIPSTSAPRVAAGVSGGVLLIWRQGKDSLHAEICRPDRFEWMRMRADGTADHWVDGGELVRF
jgi:hypothetical protein